MRIIIDTNIIISAIRNPNGTPFAAYAKAAQPPYKIVTAAEFINDFK
ncbi:hypothetical protein [Desulfoscipio sp. XC116]